MVSDKQQEGGITTLLKNLTKKITQKYVDEVIREVIKRSVKQETGKLKEKRILKLEEKLKKLADKKKLNRFKADKVVKEFARSGVNGEQIVAGINTIFDKTILPTLTVFQSLLLVSLVMVTAAVVIGIILPPSNGSPSASFTASCVDGETVICDASDSYDPDGTIIRYRWDFDDGFKGEGKRVTHLFSSGGVHHVTLMVTDDQGDTDSETKVVTVGQPHKNRLPLASFTFQSSHPVGEERITFEASSSYDPDGRIVRYTWNFGDGLNDEGEVVIHSYVNSGSYEVTLTVTDDRGAVDSETKVVTVGQPPKNRLPLASFTFQPSHPVGEERITFDASDSYDPDGRIVRYTWGFSDGSRDEGEVVTYSYGNSGGYEVTLTVTDDRGAIDSETKVVTVALPEPQLPVAAFTFQPPMPTRNQGITFDASESYDPDGTIVRYTWDLGNSFQREGEIIETEYDSGSYTVTLTVTDNQGNTDSETKVVTVVLPKNQPPVASFTFQPPIPIWNQGITFDASESYDPDGTIVRYTWDLGNGFQREGKIVGYEYQFSDSGSYTVTLTVTDDQGNTDSETKVVTLNIRPEAVFVVSPTHPIRNQEITFDASKSYDFDGKIVRYRWNFGDRSRVEGRVVTHSYGNPGSYTVTLTVTDDRGATDSAIQEVLCMYPLE